MRILLIAYEFPPIIAAQSLRWFYLTQELAQLGTEIHVLCPSMPALQDFPVKLHDNVILHRVWPGPYVGLSQRLALGTLGETKTSAAIGGTNRPFLLTAYRLIRKVLDHALYPDLRSEWYPFAKPRLKSLLAQYRFDVVISSHEPGVDILLGLWAKKRFSLKWIVDLGDPLLAPYTPAWRRKIDGWFERLVLKRADGIVVTTDRILDFLIKRHGITDRSKFVSIPQGFTNCRHLTQLRPMHELPKGMMHIVFTGTFYRDFRNPEHFATALRTLKAHDIAVTIAGDNPDFIPIFYDIPNVRFMGKIDHFQCLELQNQADLLLNIGNVQSYQLPGKIYEYLGTVKPIFYIQTGVDDLGAELIKNLGAGIVIENDATKIIECLTQTIHAWRCGLFGNLFSPNRDAINQHSWAKRAKVYQQLLNNLR